MLKALIAALAAIALLVTVFCWHFARLVEDAKNQSPE